MRWIRWPDEVCLIESDRDREKERLTYRQFKQAAFRLAAALAGARLSRRRPRRHHHDESVEMADFGLRRFSMRAACWCHSITN